ncbi:MAG TPA: DUF397 domain-containing protein [Streptosporangiaceae bacterium]|nr:DUF397 domain-containing protein [Streptosporangiaceae bacterium]
MNSLVQPVAVWQRSSYSGTTGNCVEVAPLPRLVTVRDSKNPDGPVLRLTPQQWRHLVAGIKGHHS